MNVNELIGQHRNAVALSFYKFGYTGPVNAHTVQAMIEYVGNPFIAELQKNIAYVGYAAPDLPILVPQDGGTGTLSRRLAADFQPGGIYADPVPEPQPLPPAPPVFTPVLGPAPVPVNPGLDQPAPPPVASPPLLGNGGMLSGGGMSPTMDAPFDDSSGIGSSVHNAYKQAAAPANTADKPFWEKYQTAIIAVVVILILVMLLRRPAAPVILK